MPLPPADQRPEMAATGSRAVRFSTQGTGAATECVSLLRPSSDNLPVPRISCPLGQLRLGDQHKGPCAKVGRAQTVADETAEHQAQTSQPVDNDVSPNPLSAYPLLRW